MFDLVRKHQRVLQLLLLILIVPSFLLFGIEGYSRFNEGGNSAVATVDGQKITQAEWDVSHREQAERMRRQVPNIDPKVFDSPEARAETLDALLRERVMATAVKKLNISVSDDRLQRLFVNDPQFAMVRNADGSVNKDLLAAQGMTSEVFAARLRQDLAQQQVQAGIVVSSTVSSTVAGQAMDALLQRRTVRLQAFEAKNYLGKVTPTDAELEAFYKKNEADFRAAEQAKIEYVVIDMAQIKQTIAVSEDELKAYYTQNASRYSVAEERRARHILIKADKDAAAGDKAKAKAQAEALLAEARKNPAGFAALAKANSQDEGSAAQGGDLDFFGRGAMVKPFEDAAFALKPGEISNLVESEFGFHIIQLEAVRGGDKKPFEAVRAQLEDEVRQQQASKRWAEAAEQFSNMVYEQSDSLQPVIDKFKLVKQTATVQRSPAPGATGALASPKLLEAVFSGDVLKNKRNTDAAEVGANQLAAARVLEHSPARTQPLAEVRELVRQRVALQQAEGLARKEGEALLAKLKADPAAASSLSQPLTVSRLKGEGLPPPVLQAVLAADTAKLPAAVGTLLAGQAYVVAQVQAVLPRDNSPEEAKALSAQIAQVQARAEAEAYYQALKQRFKVERKVDPVAAAAAAASAAKP